MMPRAHEDREALLSRLIEHYRDVGWWVERPDLEGLDLRLRRDAKVLLLACADPGTPASQAFVDVLRRHLAGQVVDGAILVAPAGLDAEAMPAAQGTERLRVLDREALHGLLGEAVVDAPSMPATPSNASSSRKHPKGRKANRFDLLFRAIAVLCAIGFVLAVLVLLSRTAETAAEPPPDPAPASTR